MRFLNVSHFFESHGGGIERVAGHLCRELAAAGHQCVWAASASDVPPDDARFVAVPVSCFNLTERLTGLPMPIPGPAGLVRLVQAVREADIVVVHDALYVTSIVAMLVASLQRKPVILIQHIAGIAFASRLMRLIMGLANRLVTQPMLGQADQVVFISATVQRAFAAVRGKRPSRLVFNGVDTTVFAPGPRERSAFGLPESAKVMAFVGRFVEKKGMAVIHALARHRPDLTFAMVGSGPQDPRQWQLPNVTVFGPQSPTQIASLFRAADALLIPSVGEGYPLVIQEAMACGLPVLCGSETALADPGASHWLRAASIDLTDPSGTAERLELLVDCEEPTPVDRAAMAAYAKSAYSWSGMARSLAEFATMLTRQRQADSKA